MRLDPTRPFIPLQIAVITLSDTRTEENDTSGAYLVDALTKGGHTLIHKKIIPDQLNQIVQELQHSISAPNIDVVLCTGGTGLTGRDQTPEALEQVVEKWIPGFGELFRWLSFQKIGTSTIQSRACAGLAKGTLIFALPGSTGACRDAWTGILEAQLNSQHRPCNFAELIPRLQESSIRRK